ncbi:hypothetical protein [Pedobacter sp. SYSU D00535]|uniref:hypothetical protein n=1 Tax=Pedobacter sp. SYSU D00535 TaxID=2810308 RepID=UPI001A96F129|nr:hypothetical protein [Pedobacter sp. SYSU D00535]
MKLTRTVSIFVLAAVFSLSAFSQKQVDFRMKFLPNKTYTTEMVNDMKMEMDFLGDTAKRNQMLSNGLELPMQMDMLQEMSLSTQTGQLTADRRIPLTISYNKMDVTMNMQGKEMKQPNQFSGLKIKGYATESGKLSVEAIEGSSSAEMKEAIEKMVSQLLNAVQFPDKPMKQGDTFTQELPMIVPAGANSLNLVVKINYTLKEVKEKQAFFDYTQAITLDMKAEQANSTATGSGTGKMIYDIPLNYITDTTSDMILNMSMAVGDVKMKINATAKSTVKAKVL